jgi:hypothetical protein
MIAIIVLIIALEVVFDEERAHSELASSAELGDGCDDVGDAEPGAGGLADLVDVDSVMPSSSAVTFAGLPAAAERSTWRMRGVSSATSVE